ncbi:MAG: glycine cleavage system aminomethyltransferase GcvT, partial [Candidatus Tectomicrobia bacterium]|nr:glycine cleavage system aminomethyltransferase GcvT [Candidatus Tectomicrobia bacterium]
MTELLKTPLHHVHLAAGARMAPFAGYEMPLRYSAGDIAEHQQARSRAALFDVSHMGQVHLAGPRADAALESLVPGDLRGLGPGQVRYTVFTHDGGGILDDLMVARDTDGLRLVVNAARKEHDIAHLRRHLGGTLDVVPEPDRALLALQGPAAVEVLAGYAGMAFMSWREAEVCGLPVRVSRSGYTGEDGFELSVAADDAEALAARLLAHEA